MRRRLWDLEGMFGESGRLRWKLRQAASSAIEERVLGVNSYGVGFDALRYVPVRCLDLTNQLLALPERVFSTSCRC